MNGVDLLTPDLKKPAFNTPEGRRAGRQARPSHAIGAINKISWTGRWVEPNGAFAAGNVGMLHAHSRRRISSSRARAHGSTPTRSASAKLPGYWSTPTNHGFGISKGSNNPELAWAFIKHITAQQKATQFAASRRILTGNAEVDKALLAQAAETDPLVYAVLQHPDRPHRQDRRQLAASPTTAGSRTPSGPSCRTRCSAARPAKQALADAERRVARELSRA